MRTYADKWREPDGRTSIGRLALDPRTLRLDGRPALVVERPDGHYLVADAGMGAPVIQELVDRLTELRLVVQERCGKTAVGLRPAPDRSAPYRLYRETTSRGRTGGTT